MLALACTAAAEELGGTAAAAWAGARGTAGARARGRGTAAARARGRGTAARGGERGAGRKPARRSRSLRFEVLDGIGCGCPVA